MIACIVFYLRYSGDASILTFQLKLLTAGLALMLTIMAIEFHERFQIRYWDALIVATARLGGCGVVLSEDLSNGQNYGGVTILNLFNDS